RIGVGGQERLRSTAASLSPIDQSGLERSHVTRGVPVFSTLPGVESSGVRGRSGSPRVCGTVAGRQEQAGSVDRDRPVARASASVLKYTRSGYSKASRQLLGKYVRPSGRAAHGWERRNGLTTALALESRPAGRGTRAGGADVFGGEGRFGSAESFGNADAIGGKDAFGSAEALGDAGSFGRAGVRGGAAGAGPASGGAAGADFSSGADPSIGPAGGTVS